MPAVLVIVAFVATAGALGCEANLRAALRQRQVSLHRMIWSAE